MKVKSESEVTQSCLTLSDPMDYSLPGSSVMGFSRQEYWSGVPLPSPVVKQKEKITGVAKDVDTWKPLHIAGENIKCCSHYRNSIDVLEKDKHRITI